MQDYWTPAHDEALKQYYHATTIKERNRVIDTVLKAPLYEMATRCLTSFGLRPDPEKQQDIVVHLVFKVLPNLSEDKLKGALQYLWVAARNYALTYIMKPKTYSTVDITSLFCVSADAIRDDVGDFNRYGSEAYVSGMYIDDEYRSELLTVQPDDLDREQEVKQIRERVMAEIDLKLKGQRVVNATNSVFLMLLKQYLLDNDFDTRGFGCYVMRVMHLKLNTYRAVAGRLGLRTRDFNESI